MVGARLAMVGAGGIPGRIRGAAAVWLVTSLGLVRRTMASTRARVYVNCTSRLLAFMGPSDNKPTSRAGDSLAAPLAPALPRAKRLFSAARVAPDSGPPRDC